jgi:hypothetical protein
MVKRKQILIMCVFLTAATFIAFWRVTHREFTNYDDPDYVTENSHIQDGMAMEGIGWAFTTGYEG